MSTTSKAEIKSKLAINLLFIPLLVVTYLQTEEKICLKIKNLSAQKSWLKFTKLYRNNSFLCQQSFLLSVNKIPRYVFHTYRNSLIHIVFFNDIHATYIRNVRTLSLLLPFNRTSARLKGNRG